MRRCDPLSLALSAAIDQRRRILGITQRSMAQTMARSQGRVSQLLDGCIVHTTPYSLAADALDCEIVVTVRPRHA